MRKIILTGGGTAGHIMPNIALIPYLNDFEIHYIGAHNSLEEKLISKYNNVIFHSIPVTKLVRCFTFKNLSIPFKLINSINKCKKIINDIQPDIIFSKGGFVGLPVSLASKKIPVILHESDFSLGLANRIAYKKCDTLLTAFEINKYKAIHVGTPIRQEIYNGNKLIAQSICKFNNTLPILMVTGGSQGASKINDTIIASLKELTKHYNIIHIVGNKNIKNIKYKNYCELGFVDNMSDFYAYADFIISRGGANSLFEIISLKKPALIIPLPKDQSRGDQIDNANYFEKLGCVNILLQEKLSPTTLIDKLDKLCINKNKLITNMTNIKKIDATRDIANFLRKKVGIVK